jgi:hypothetical protein
MNSDKKIINGREVEIIGHYYISTSICSSGRWNLTTSMAMGEWHIGSKKQIVLDHSMARVKYSKGNAYEKEKARNKLLAIIERLKKENKLQREEYKSTHSVCDITKKIIITR